MSTATIEFAERYTDAHDRSNWRSGPWSDEPEDKVVWVDEATDLDCMAVRNTFGVWCGYVGVPPGHRFHGVDYGEVDVRVHGGLTFSGACSPSPKGPQEGICHLEQDGRPGSVWWLGFDCNHAWDIAPGADFGMPMPGSEYRDLGYVVGECQSLAEQVASDR